MNIPKIIQGGMGAAISTWKLAKAVSLQGGLGVVSGTSLETVMVARLMNGDVGGHVRRALSHFPIQEAVQKILARYYVEGGLPAGRPYKRSPMWTINPPRRLNEIAVIANFTEVFLAKEGHNNPVGINLLEKIQMPIISSLYGAILGGVDVVIMGAGIPTQMPGVLDALACHQDTSYRLDVSSENKDDEYRIQFKPDKLFPTLSEKIGDMTRPWFLPIISSDILAKALIKRANGKINGFVIETSIAGGHNAPPRGSLKLNEQGEPIYGKRDEANLDKMKKIGLPFWLAGGYGSPKRFQEAVAIGAAGVQVGTAFAYCDESGMAEDTKRTIIQKILTGQTKLRTDPIYSPTGFPFKIVNLEGTISEKDVYELRTRICDIGILQHIYRMEDGTLGYRCPAEPVENYIRKGGLIEDTEGRTCLCNNLMSAAGFPQHRKGGYVEPPLITSGDEFVNIGQFFKPGETSYTAKDVIDHLTNSSQS